MKITYDPKMHEIDAELRSAAEIIERLNLTPYIRYAHKYATDHGITISEALSQPEVKAMLSKYTGEE